MKELLELKEKLEREIEEIQEFLNKKNDYSIQSLLYYNVLQNKKDLLKLIEIQYTLM